MPFFLRMEKKNLISDTIFCVFWFAHAHRKRKYNTTRLCSDLFLCFSQRLFINKTAMSQVCSRMPPLLSSEAVIGLQEIIADALRH